VGAAGAEGDAGVSAAGAEWGIGLGIRFARALFSSHARIFASSPR
jgi:hypothetical protein